MDTKLPDDVERGTFGEVIAEYGFTEAVEIARRSLAHDCDDNCSGCATCYQARSVHICNRICPHAGQYGR